MQCLPVDRAVDLTDDTAQTAIDLSVRADAFRANHSCLVAFASLDGADAASVLEGSDDGGSTWETIAFAIGAGTQFKECTLKEQIRSKPQPATLTLDADGLALAQQPNIAADTDGLVAAANPAADTPMTLLAAAASLSPARLVTLTSASDISGADFRITGEDENGDYQTEVVTGPNNATVSSTGRYSKVTEITPDATVANNVEAGWPVTYEPMTLVASVDALDPFRQVSLTSTGDFSGVAFTVQGTDLMGNYQEEVITGPNNTTVTGTKFFAGVTAIIPDPTDTVVATNISAGWIAQTAAGAGSMALLGN